MDKSNIEKLIIAGDIEAVQRLLDSGELVLVDGGVMSKDDYDAYMKAKEQSEYFDMLQGVRKVLLKLRLVSGMTQENLVNSVKVLKRKTLSQAAPAEGATTIERHALA